MASRHAAPRLSGARSGWKKRSSSTTRALSVSLRTSCSKLSSKRRHRPSAQVRQSAPTRMRQPPPGGTAKPRWQVNRRFVGAQWGRIALRGARRLRMTSPPPEAQSSAASGTRSRTKRAVAGAAPSTAPAPRSTTSRQEPSTTAPSWAPLGPRPWPPTSDQVSASTSAAASARTSPLIASSAATQGNDAPSHQGCARRPRSK
mmetsp:Transcript_17094/g.58955  ORF Transcript_17094/g.58955 Transcript_17094/m.58955 type:complete len:202 (+) Transcript_17094:72-677(+)